MRAVSLCTLALLGCLSLGCSAARLEPRQEALAVRPQPSVFATRVTPDPDYQPLV